MGCDIHVHTEVLVDGKWEHYGAPCVERWYKLFEKMAGVRGDLSNAIRPPRGLPNDCSVLTKLDADDEGEDGHSWSWFDQEDIRALYAWWGTQGYELPIESEFGYLFGNGWDGLPECSPLKDRVTDVRWVFWFDN